MSDDKQSPSRRNLIKGMVFIPIGVAGAAGAMRALQPSEANAADTAAPEGKPDAYTPAFFNAVEWRFLTAAVDRLIPHDEHGPGAIELGVLEFLDRHMQTPYASGDIWYMQGPFVEAPRRNSAIRASCRCATSCASASRNLDAYCAKPARRQEIRRPRSQVQQEELLKAAEAGKLKLDDISAKLFFTNLLNEVRNGYFADPSMAATRAWARGR
jgi:gluconate 2-dehydrogenase gamma chain